MSVLKSEFSQSRNDLYWSVWTADDGTIRWIGYDDDYWWDKVSISPDKRTRTGSKSGKIYTIDFNSGDVTVEAGGAT